MSSGAPLDHQTVTVRVQVIDLQSFTLDLTLPTYLPARDLSQRIARDAGLTAYDDQAKRRRYWMRARGRLVQEHETLADLGVVNQELVYFLPEPPPGTEIAEQTPDYPSNRGYAAKGLGAIVGSILGLISWAILWGWTLVVDRSLWTVALPGMAMGLICTSLSRHMWGGHGNQARIVATAIGLFVLMFGVVFLPAVYVHGDEVVSVYQESILGFIVGLLGVLAGWLAWSGSVEPLPNRDITEHLEDQRSQDLEVVPCAICGQGVDVSVRENCSYGCGRVFHTGCYNARVAVYRGDRRYCAICNAMVG